MSTKHLSYIEQVELLRDRNMDIPKESEEFALEIFKLIKDNKKEDSDKSSK